MNTSSHSVGDGGLATPLEQGKLNIGIFLFPGMTMMDAYAPLQVLAVSGLFNVFTFAKTPSPLPSDANVSLLPNYGFADTPPIDVLIVPGGANPSDQMQDEEVVDFLRRSGRAAKYVTSVCTGALILAQTGLLDGYRTAIHWAYADALKAFPNVTFESRRIVHDRDRISGGGITAGLDFALYLIGEIAGKQQGAAMELLLEYDPAPPFQVGHPARAPLALKQGIQAKVMELAPGLFG
ncbi:DJ-1/PfpI family protein [Ferrimonas futtsuensis]|uniref:DJ-1/PfpI family protein n=1 Tax=Ferrimonas futtsuensis TaxID=364764 RepID=UPI0003FD5C2D|nr:DJ-1/PfpI family protein [Ferrimonas futtsuensis]